MSVVERLAPILSAHTVNHFYIVGHILHSEIVMSNSVSVYPHLYRQHRRRRKREDTRRGRCETSGGNGTLGVAVRSILMTALASIVVKGFAPESYNSKSFSAHRKLEHTRGGSPWRCNNNIVGGPTKANKKFFLLRLPMNSEGGNVPETSNETDQTKIAIEELMAKHDPILLFASRLLPPDKAADASALYAWCRRLDEICDNEDDAAGGNNLEPVRENLGVWQSRFEALWSTTTEPNEVDNQNIHSNNYAKDEYLMDLALKKCIEKYQGDGTERSLLTRTPFDDMIEGMKSDAVEGRRIQTMEELEVYAYRVAGTVGLMLLPLLLSENDDDSSNGNTAASFERTLLAIEKAREPAICLGQAIQLVNILRDATQDAKLGRIYLPQDMLSNEGVDESSIFELGLNPSSGVAAPDGYKIVVKKVSVRALELLAIAESGKDTLPAPLGPIFVQIIVELYRDYLDELDRRGYDNLSNSGDGEDRVKISTLRKAKASLRAIATVGKELLGVPG